MEIKRISRNYTRARNYNRLKNNHLSHLDINQCMEKLHSFYYILELAGTFAFAISGAVAARQRGLDLFGICALAFTVACGGGIIRDL